jgi:hypothetical protein
METNEFYSVETPFYQYNSGAGDNGTYYPKREFASAEKAIQFKRILDAAYDAGRNDNYEGIAYTWANKIIGEWFYGGYITGYSKIFHEIKKKEQIA